MVAVNTFGDEMKEHKPEPKSRFGLSFHSTHSETKENGRQTDNQETAIQKAENEIEKRRGRK